MRHYRAYLLDGAGQIRSLRQLVCDSDEEACAKAKEVLAGQTGELWTGPRKVARFDAEKPAKPA